MIQAFQESPKVPPYPDLLYTNMAVLVPGRRILITIENIAGVGIPVYVPN